MKLDGQCKSAFEKWLDSESNEDGNKRIDPEGHYGFGCGYDGCETEITVSDVFDELPHSMQHGVKVKFFDSVGININVNGISDFWYIKVRSQLNSTTIDKDMKTREEAETKAERKANDYYNENN